MKKMMKKAMRDVMLMLASCSFPTVGASTRWSTDEVVKFIAAHPQRAYFSRLFRDGGFRTGIEVGVAGGRFSEHMLIDNAALPAWSWSMMEPFPSGTLTSRYPAFGRPSDNKTVSSKMAWSTRGIGSNARLTAIRELSTAKAALDATAGAQYDFIYLDGAHDYVNVKAEMYLYWPKVAPGGMLAGHDYCDQKEDRTKEANRSLKLPLRCLGCSPIPTCGTYTEIAGTQSGRRARTQVAVVQAVQEWLLDAEPQLTLHHTLEDFTREGFATDGIDYKLLLTKTRNPSWFVMKPLEGRQGHSGGGRQLQGDRG
mmetsp:Transcript_20447/g.47171  ORF Transcript_20447/g.47171 Transcript_20447/m.47171 type:complete len:311 (-) Transcript_20447:143-1075(-)